MVTKNGHDYASETGVKIIERDELLKLTSSTIGKFRDSKEINFIKDLEINCSYYEYTTKIVPLLRDSITPSKLLELKSLNLRYQKWKQSQGKKCQAYNI